MHAFYVAKVTTKLIQKLQLGDEDNKVQEHYSPTNNKSLNEEAKKKKI